MARVLVLGSVAESLISFRGSLLQSLVDRDHKVFACAPNAPEEIKDVLARMGVVYHEVQLDRTGLNPIKDTRTMMHLIRLFNNIRPDIVLSYTVKPVVYGSLAAHFAGVEKIYSIITGLGDTFSDGGLKTRVLGLVVRKLYKLALKFNQNIFFQNPDDLDLFQTEGLYTSSHKAVLINGSGIDTELFHPESYPSSPSFLLIARLLKNKGVCEYVEAAGIVRKKYPEIKFRLAGYIDNKPSAILEQELQTWIRSGSIEYLGYLRDVHPALADSSVYVLPSYREGTPHTVLEAMATARPIITTDVPGCRETVRDGENGFLIPVRNVPALVEAMVHFIKQTEDIKRMGLISRQFALEKYDVHKVNAVIIGSMGLD